jgi:predicted membrane GTPase involved in stress response
MKRKPESHRFDAQFKNEDWQKISKRAAQCNLKPTAFIRKIARHGEIKLYNIEQVNELTLQLHHIGNNINQIAHLAHEVKSVNETDIENLQKHMKNINEAITDWCKPLDYEEF